MIRFKYIFFFLTILWIPLSAANVTVKATMDSTAIWMGQQTKIHLERVQDKSQPILDLPLGANLSEGVEIVNILPPDTVKLSDDRIQINRDIVVTSFDSGFYYIPPFRSVLGKDTFETNSLSLKVIPMEVDTTQMGFDIKNVQSPKFVLQDFLPSAYFLWIILLIAVIAVLVCYLYERHLLKKNGIVFSPENILPAHEKALTALENLKSEHLWQAGQDKEYYTRVTDILRTYLEDRFAINAMEMTSSELLWLLRKNEVIAPVYNKLKEVLELADYVKFAKLKPLADDNEHSMLNAYLFVEETKEKPEEKPETENEGDSVSKEKKENESKKD